jgi:2,4-didehydro-3-deoxy-L-rhamnonate hydrolase
MLSTMPAARAWSAFESFAPIGPVLVTLDEFDDPASLELTTTITGADGTQTRVQHGSTSQLIFSVAELVSRLSQTLELLPGDLVFTGTPPGVGAGMDPKRFLRDGETLTTEIERIGTIVQRFHA